LDVGVPIFFLLSAFLLYRPFVRARIANEEASVGAYAWRRGLRIYPGYWVALIVAVLALDLSGVLTPRYLLLLQSYWSDSVAGGLPQAWTLCIEVAFYAFLPLWAWLVRRLRAPELPALGVLFAISVLYKVVVLNVALGEHVGAVDPWIIALPSYWDTFAVGMALAVISTRRPIPGHPAAWWLGAAALFVLAAKGAGLAHPSPEGFTHTQIWVRHYLYTAIAFCALAGALTGPGPLETRPPARARARLVRHSSSTTSPCWACSASGTSRRSRTRSTRTSSERLRDRGDAGVRNGELVPRGAPGAVAQEVRRAAPPAAGTAPSG
jgi:peptidoglycan/LPS O-acetylase OafA/YrhL